MRGGGLQAAVGLSQGAGGDGGVVEVDGVEEGLAEHAADGVGRLVWSVEVFLTRQADGGFVLTVRTKWQWFTDMQPPRIALQLAGGQVAPFLPEPVLTPLQELAGSSSVRWLTSQLEHSLSRSARSLRYASPVLARCGRLARSQSSVRCPAAQW